jgi:CheY-like chemotaxis protein
MGTTRPSLTWRDPQEALESLATRATGEATGPRVLVIEDDETLRHELRDVLAEHGCTVLEAENGKVALNRLIHEYEAGAEPDLILLDLRMPVMSGWEFIAIVKSYIRLARIPIVVTAGQEPNPEAFRHGAVAAFIRKPHRVEQLLAVVREHTRGRPGQ